MKPPVSIQFHGSLVDFLPAQKRCQSLLIDCVKNRSVKDLIESVGVPHPEIDLIIVNTHPVDFSHLVHGGEKIEVYPPGTSLHLASAFHLYPSWPTPPRFILDVHLGKLAAYLRLFGFDSLYRNDYDDPELADISAREQRILLTCDIKLLMRKQINFGYCVRSRQPTEQLIEVAQRFRLKNHTDKMLRCIECNGIIKAVEKQQILSQLQPLTRQHYDEFYQCDHCGKIYWKGSHYDHMQELRKHIQST